MSFESSKRTFDDESSESSGPDSPVMYPLLLKDVDGRKKFIFSDEEAKNLRLRVERAQKEEVLFKGFMENEKKQNITRKKACHGLAPKGMSIPKKGGAYLVGGIGGKPEVLKESNLEKYNRIGAELEDKRNKKDKKVVKKLKKDGKITTLASFMYS
jgi:hypothetical protein